MKTRDVLFLLTIAILALAMTACSPVVAPEVADSEAIANEAEAVLEGNAADESDTATSISDTAWSVVTYGLETDNPPIEGTFLTVNFMIDRYNGYTGCNYMLGTFDAKAESIIVHWPSTSAGECADEALAKQESNFLSALTAVNAYAIVDNQLHLYVGDISVMTLEPLEAVPFEGTTWNLQFIQQQPVGWVPPLDGATLTAVFDGESVSGNAGCNSYTGSYELNGRTIRFDALASTMMMCEDEDLMTQETDYLQALQNAGIIITHPRSFELRDGEGISMMIFGAE